MKKILLSLVAFVIAIISYAQNTLVATLTHGDNITMYYGTYAFRDAHNAAVDGDIINLSGGKFNSTTITKGISIRGAGVEVANPTYIINSFDINIPTTATERLSIEGCRFVDKVTARSMNNALLLKNYFHYQFEIGSSVTNSSFVNCVLDSWGNGYWGLSTNSGSSNSSAQFINCRINHVRFDAGAFTFINCVITPINGYTAYCISNSQLLNCILYYTTSNSSYYKLPDTSSAWNCVAISAYAQDVFSNLSSSQNCKYATKDIFISSNPMNDLTDEAKATYLGTDGTPVGMYGGVMPFNQIPTYPRITKMNVANRTTADGKLSVEIEVSATE